MVQEILDILLLWPHKQIVEIFEQYISPLIIAIAQNHHLKLSRDLGDLLKNT